MPEGGAPLNELRAYFRGIHAALTLLQKRLAARPNLTGPDAIAEIERYDRVIQESLEALDAKKSS